MECNGFIITVITAIFDEEKIFSAARNRQSFPDNAIKNKVIQIMMAR